jgi:cytidine deaminase
METKNVMKNNLKEAIIKISEKYSDIITQEKLLEMANLSIKSKDNSYSPYSKFRVGCCLLTSDGKLFTGTNVENVSYGLSICAERCAVFNAVSQGARNIKVAVVCTDMEHVVTPCGACRQVLVEFGLENCFSLSLNDINHMTADELLPNSCRIDHLKKD